MDLFGSCRDNTHGYTSIKWCIMRFSKVGQSVYYDTGSKHTVVKIDDHFYPMNVLLESKDGDRFWTSEDKIEPVDLGSNENPQA